MRMVEMPAQVQGNSAGGPIGMPSEEFFQQMGAPGGGQQFLAPQRYEEQPQQYGGGGEYFQRANDLRVIQEYNNDELLPPQIKRDFWGLISKSIKLGFWNEEDEQNLFLHKNIIRVGHIMARPKQTYTFEERQSLNMVDLLAYADFKRGVGMERYRINERTLQATSVTQNIQGGGSPQRKAGMLASLKSFFG